MHAMMMVIRRRSGGTDGRAYEPSILLAGDSAGRTQSLRRALEDAGFEVCYAGDYSQLEQALDTRRYDVILLDVSSEHAAEAAVAAALRVRRANNRQFIGYLTDSSPALASAGLGGDGVFPRTAADLPQALRLRLSAEDWGDR